MAATCWDLHNRPLVALPELGGANQVLGVVPRGRVDLQALLLHERLQGEVHLVGWDVVAAASVVDVVVMITATPPLVHHERVRVDPVSRPLDEGGRVHREAGIVDRFHTAAKPLVVLVHDALRVEELRDRVHVRELTNHERARGHLLVGHCENDRVIRELDQLGVDIGHIGADHNRSGRVASDGVLARGRTLLGGGILLRGGVGYIRDH